MTTTDPQTTAATPPAEPSSASASTLPPELPAQLVKDLQGAFGRHHARAVHAKGTIVQGRFRPSTAARSLCRAAIFDDAVEIVARFSDFTGIPDISDTEPGASPRGLAVKFLCPEGHVDIVTHSYDGFPVRTSEEFGVLLRALAAPAPADGEPSALDRFLDTHPIARTFLTSQDPPPRSYATCPFFGVNAVWFTAPDDTVRAVRYRLVPEAGVEFLDSAALAERNADYLQTEIRERLSAGPVRFRWLAQLAATDDVVDDPSIAWPADRELVDLGGLEIDGLGADTPDADRALMFSVGTLPPWIAPADPMLTVRTGAYPRSFAQRQ